MSEGHGIESEPASGRRLSTEEALEIESDRRRRVVAAFLLGTEARPDGSAVRPWRGLLAGTAVTAVILVVVGVFAVAGATLAAGEAPRSTPAPSSSASTAP